MRASIWSAALLGQQLYSSIENYINHFGKHQQLINKYIKSSRLAAETTTLSDGRRWMRCKRCNKCIKQPKGQLRWATKHPRAQSAPTDMTEYIDLVPSPTYICFSQLNWYDTAAATHQHKIRLFRGAQCAIIGIKCANAEGALIIIGHVATAIQMVGIQMRDYKLLNNFCTLNTHVFVLDSFAIT